MMRHYSVIIFLFVLALSFPLATEATWQTGLDWRVEESFALEAVKLNWWLAPRWGVRTVYAWAEEDLGLALVHIPQTRSAFNSYVGLGVRDLLDNNQLPWSEKIELTAGVELRLDRHRFLTSPSTMGPRPFAYGHRGGLMTTFTCWPY